MNETLTKVAVTVVAVTVAIVIALVLIVASWAWVVPDVFAGAVAQGLLPATLTLAQAFKLAMLVGILFSGIRSNSDSKR